MSCFDVLKMLTMIPGLIIPWAARLYMRYTLKGKMGNYFYPLNNLIPEESDWHPFIFFKVVNVCQILLCVQQHVTHLSDTSIYFWINKWMDRPWYAM